ncbi:hypothetical protein MKZ38_003140 [Zalerion maritima]|uniref:Uncharacterized protein n=1 Tax=Zalerion maritima TaxID=339359 RepID=A0AAD5RY15_9PEZI|nr:hypothetical protein MKZ38_003140 [Zalerion maritima]
MGYPSLSASNTNVMEALGAAASVFGAVSLAIQLIDKLRRLASSDASADTKGFGDDLSSSARVLDEVKQLTGKAKEAELNTTSRLTIAATELLIQGYVTGLEEWIKREAANIAERLDRLSGSSDSVLCHSRSTNQILSEVRSNMSSLRSDVVDIKATLLDYISSGSAASSKSQPGGNRRDLPKPGFEVHGTCNSQPTPSHRREAGQRRDPMVPEDATVSSDSNDDTHEPEFEYLFFTSSIQASYPSPLSDYVVALGSWRLLGRLAKALGETSEIGPPCDSDQVQRKRKMQSQKSEVIKRLLVLRKMCLREGYIEPLQIVEEAFSMLPLRQRTQWLDIQDMAQDRRTLRLDLLNPRFHIEGAPKPYEAGTHQAICRILWYGDVVALLPEGENDEDWNRAEKDQDHVRDGLIALLSRYSLPQKPWAKAPWTKVMLKHWFADGAGVWMDDSISHSQSAVLEPVDSDAAATPIAWRSNNGGEDCGGDERSEFLPRGNSLLAERDLTAPLENKKPFQLPQPRMPTRDPIGSEGARRQNGERGSLGVS